MDIASVDFDAMLSVLRVGNSFAVVMIVSVVCWALRPSAGTSVLSVESGIAAGLRMSDRGEQAMLEAAKRMGLMGYAQIASRIGGTIILLIASVAFSLPQN